MSIDLSAAILPRIKTEVTRYKTALVENDLETARVSAQKISSFYLTLSKTTPVSSKKYLDSSNEWANKAENVHIVPIQVRKDSEIRNVLNSSHGKKNDRGNNPVSHHDETETKGDTDELRKKIESFIQTTSVTWNDIGGLQEVKHLLMESLVLAGIQKPDGVQPTHAVLMYGLPGCGKSLIAAAAANCLNATFFNVSVSGLLSKYYGESSKMIQTLFAVAREKAPSIIFIDEIDALTLSRDGKGGNDASLRVLSTLLIEMDGFSTKNSDNFVLTMGGTNHPESLDRAILSRFQRKILIPLPDEDAIKDMLQINFRSFDTTEIDLADISKKCVQNRYSGRDISALSNCVIQDMIHSANPNLHKLSELAFDEIKKRRLQVLPLNEENFNKAFEQIKSPVTDAMLMQLDDWNKQFGN